MSATISNSSQLPNQKRVGFCPARCYRSADQLRIGVVTGSPFFRTVFASDYYPESQWRPFLLTGDSRHGACARCPEYGCSYVLFNPASPTRPKPKGSMVESSATVLLLARYGEKQF